MKLRAIALLACGPAICLLLIACGLLDGQRLPAQESQLVVAQPTTVRISQLGNGRDARFTTCAEPACPAITAKVIATASSPDHLATRLAAQPAFAPPTADAKPVPIVQESTPHAARATKDDTSAAPRKLTLHFGTNAARLTPAHKATLSAALGELRHSDLIVISGRTDDIGSESANQALALARGLAVRDHLLDLDPNLPARIAIDAKGRCCYAATNDSIAGRARNRRVEIAHGPSDREMP
jgi:outer membrane protein OmpA-like peptidoglycan-associated protein